MVNVTTPSEGMAKVDRKGGQHSHGGHHQGNDDEKNKG